MYTHLRTHSYYSFLEGLASPADLVQAAKEAGMPALALTDHNTLTGAIEFYEACQGFGIKPILGLEVDVEILAGQGAGRLVFLATGLDGWGSLCRLSSAVLTDLPRQDGESLALDLVAQNSTGLICLSGGRRGLVSRLLLGSQHAAADTCLRALSEIFPQRLYAELQLHKLEDQLGVAELASLARKTKIPLIATQDIYYLLAEQADLQRVLSAMRLNCRIDELPQDAAAPPQAHFLISEEMQRKFSDFPDALDSAKEIMQRCNLELPLGVAHYPAIALPQGMTADERLRQKSERGAIQLYGEITPQVRERLDHELKTIQDFHYASLFLIMEEIVGYARKEGVPMSSRGSAASSLVAHCLGITSPDPLRLNLYFERFLNPARLTPPDIDTDLCSRRRDSVIRFVYERFGDERVAMVCTINRFRRRSALREVAKAYGLPSEEISAMAEALPRRWFGPRPRTTRANVPYAELAGRFRSELHQQVLRDADALLSVPHHLSIHPGGVVIAPGPMTDLVPTQLASKGVVITQFDLDAVERLGLVKIDLLGIRGLSVLGDVAETLASAGGKSDASLLDALEAIPDEDEATAELVRSGRTIGCFQIESPGMRATLREIQADSVDDLMVALALYRPGPLTGGLKDAFVRRQRGEEAVAHLHPALALLLEDTHGVILYQEQVLRIAHELAGLSLADADLLRRAMSHFDPGEQMRTLKERFIAGAEKRNAVPPAVAERVWELMAAFAGYGFPKAHAASYAQVAWRGAWCKVHYPAIFMAAVLANWGGYYSQRVYLMEARRMGLDVRPPHVNHARREFSVGDVEGEEILFMGLDQVRDLTRRTQDRIMRQRPYRSLEDFITRVDPRPVEAENLIRVGGLAGLGTIPELLAQLQSGNMRGGQLSLFPVEQPRLEDWLLEEKVAAQIAILGSPVDAHPLELHADQLTALEAMSTLEAAARVRSQVRVAGISLGGRRDQTPAGERVYRMSLEDLEGALDMVLPEGVYRRYRGELSSTNPFVVEGRIELDASSGEPTLWAGKIWRLMASDKLR